MENAGVVVFPAAPFRSTSPAKLDERDSGAFDFGEEIWVSPHATRAAAMAVSSRVLRI
jgi:hypothetical protein